MRKIVSWAGCALVAAVVLFGSAQAQAQCCGAVCGEGGGQGCGQLLSAEGLSTLSGCLEVDDLVCVGGQALPDGTLIAGCICALGSCFDASNFQAATPEQCASLARAACEQGGNVAQTAPNAGCGAGGNGGGGSGQCGNKSGGGDATNPGDGGNPNGCDNPGGTKKGLPL